MATPIDHARMCMGAVHFLHVRYGMWRNIRRKDLKEIVANVLAISSAM